MTQNEHMFIAFILISITHEIFLLFFPRDREVKLLQDRLDKYLNS